jgi:hypothetical protein
VLNESGNGVGGQAANDHGQHMDAGHERRIAQLRLEIQSNPECENWKADEAKGNDREQLYVSVMLELSGKIVTDQGEVPVFPYCHINHGVRILHFPYHKGCHKQKTDHQQYKYVWRLPSMWRIARKTYFISH